jgi:hypothetical protein
MMFNRSVAIERELNSAKPQENNSTEIFTAVQGMIEAAQTRTEEMLNRVAAPRVASDPLEMFKSFAAMLAAMAPLFQQRPASNDLLGEVDKLLKLKELATAFGGGGGDSADSNFYDLAGKLVDRLGPAFVSAVQMKAAGATPSTPTLPAPSTPQPQPTTAAQPQGDSSMKAQIAILVGNAKSGVDPETMAQTILDATPDEKLDALFQFVNAPDCIAKMTAMNPEVSSPALLPWFESLRKNIIGHLQEPEDSATVPPAST